MDAGACPPAWYRLGRLKASLDPILEQYEQHCSAWNCVYVYQLISAVLSSLTKNILRIWHRTKSCMLAQPLRVAHPQKHTISWKHDNSVLPCPMYLQIEEIQKRGENKNHILQSYSFSIAILTFTSKAKWRCLKLPGITSYNCNSRHLIEFGWILLCFIHHFVDIAWPQTTARFRRFRRFRRQCFPGPCSFSVARVHAVGMVPELDVWTSKKVTWQRQRNKAYQN